jgi:isoquinoline 1-oxidoreductase beta subunit
MREEGDAKAALASAKKKFSATYLTPYLIHAPMEPLNATAWVQSDRCDVWAPLQDPQRIQKAVAKYLEIKPEQVHVHVTLLGGGFGRKSQPDFALEAVQISKATKKPVKLTWTREDEIKHGYYHAQAAQTIDAAYDDKGALTAWRHRSVYPTIQTVFNPAAEAPADWELGMGCTDMPYRAKTILCEGGSLKSGVNIGWLRSVCHIQHAFAVNSFVDELALHLKKDPLLYRLELLGAPRQVPALSAAWKKEGYPHDTGRMIPLIKRVRKMCHWEKKRPKGVGLGFANHYSFFSYVALAAEVEVKGSEIKVRHIYCAVDPGSMVNPDSVRAQIEGGIIFGMSLALNGKISLKDGVVEQSNFDDYPVMRMSEIPKFTVEIVSSEAPPSGIGEPGTPPVAPALASAIFAATGKRLRELPLQLA